MDALTSSTLTTTTASRDRITYCYHFHHIQDLSLTTSLQREKVKAVNVDLSNPQSESRWLGEEMNTRCWLALYHDALNRISWHCLYSPSCIEGEVRVVYLLSILYYLSLCWRARRGTKGDAVELTESDFSHAISSNSTPTMKGQYSQAHPARVPATVPPIVDIKRLQEP